MYSYKSSNFVSPPVSGDKRIRIYDISRNLKYSIEPDLSYFYVSGNCVVIKITNKNDIVLTFQNHADAVLALEKLSTIKNELGGNSFETDIGEIEFTNLSEYDYMIYFGGKWVNTHDLVLNSGDIYLGDWKITEEEGNLKVYLSGTTSWELGGEFFIQ